MTLFLQTLVSAVVAGSVYGLLGIGISLTYKTTAVINFAAGQVAVCGAYVTFALTQAHVPLGFAALGGVLVGGAVSGAMERGVLRPLYGRGPIGPILVTFGVAITLQEVTQLIWGSLPRNLPALASNHNWNIGGVVITPAEVIIVAAAAIVSLAIVVAVERTRIGRAMRGCAQDSEVVALLGVPTQRLYFISFCVAGATAGLAGVLIAPTTGLTPGGGEQLVLPGFAAAILGGFGSLPGAVVGGILIATMNNLFAVYVNASYADTVGYVAIILVLLVKVTGLFGDELEAVRSV